MITYSDPDLFMNMHGQIESFLYPSFIKHSLKRLYHILPDYFNPYRNLFNLIEYCSREPAPGSLNPSGSFTYMSLSSDPYKYVVTTSIRRKSRFSFIARLIRYLKVVASIMGEYVSS